jgi:CheY-like chemotaxis protein
MRVLVVEDDEPVAGSLRDLLLEAGHAPRIVPSVPVALARLEHEVPDAILLNLYYYFPGPNGFDFLRVPHVRELGIPLIAISGFPNDGQARECLRLGALDFADKSAPKEFLRGVVTYLEILARGRQSSDAAPGADRRRSPRPQLRLPVRIVDVSGREREATCSDLSAFGMLIRPDASFTPSPLASISFSPPDGRRPVSILSSFVREDPEGFAFRFVNLPPIEFQRLRQLIHRLTQKQRPSPALTRS